MRLHSQPRNIYWFVWTNSSSSQIAAFENVFLEFDSPVMLVKESGLGFDILEAYGARPLKVQRIGRWDSVSNSLSMVSLGIWERRNLTGMHWRVTAVHVSQVFFSWSPLSNMLLLVIQFWKKTTTFRITIPSLQSTTARSLLILTSDKFSTIWDHFWISRK